MLDKFAVAAHDVRMTYAGAKPVHALKDVTLDIRQGEMLLVMGPSGSGKSTLLSIIGGLLTPTAGSVCVSGTEITHLGRKALAHFRLQSFGYVFQAFNLFSSMTGAENVELAFDIRGVRSAWRSRARWPEIRAPSSPTSRPRNSMRKTARSSRTFFRSWRTSAVRRS